MNKSILFLVFLASISLTSWYEDDKYVLAYEGVEKLQTVIDNADTLYLRHVYHGETPIQPRGIVVVMMFTTLVNDVKETDYFSYENEEIYSLGQEAEAIYSYCEYYYELEVERINEHFGFTYYS